MAEEEQVRTVEEAIAEGDQEAMDTMVGLAEDVSEKRTAILEGMARLFQQFTGLPASRIRLVEAYEQTPEGGIRIHFHLEEKPDVSRTPAGIIVPQ